MKKNIHTLPENNSPNERSFNFSVLGSQGGYSLAEVLVVAIVLAVMVLTVYIGIEFAEKKITQGYRQRVATLLLTGELEKQYTLYMKENIFRPFTEVPVEIDKTEELTVTGMMSIFVGREVENYMTHTYGYQYVIGEIRWVDPVTEKVHFVRLREDFYD